jgi:hypothetical protein
MHSFGFLLNLLLSGCSTGFLGFVILTVYQMLAPRNNLSLEHEQRAQFAFRFAVALAMFIGAISFVGYTIAKHAGLWSK